MVRPSKEQAQALRDRWLSPLMEYFHKLAGPSHVAYLKSQALYRCIDAANRAGKTTAIQADCVANLLGKHPYHENFPQRILVLITRSDQAASVWGDRLLKRSGLPGDIGKLPWVDKHYIKKVTFQRSQKHGKYPGKIEFINGSEYYMALQGDPDSWLALEGMPFDRIYRDEASGSENLSDELEARLWDAQSASERGEKPGAGGVHWGATATKDNAEFDGFRKRTQSGLADHAYFHFPAEENLSVSMAVREKAKERMSAEAHAVRAMGVGSTIDRVKVIAPHWEAAIHETTTEEGPYRIRPDDNLWITFDPGWKDKCGILCSVVSRDRPRHIRIVAWMSYKFGGYNHAVQDMKRWLDGRVATRIVCDAQIHSSMQHNGRTYYTEFCDLLRTHKVECHADPLWAKPRIEDSLPLLQDCLQNHGENHDPYRNSLEVDMKGEGCPAFVGELLNSRWMVDREGTVMKSMVQRALESFDCLIGSTMVETMSGPKRIDAIDVGDSVLTRKGYRTVVDQWASVDDAQVYDVTMSDGAVITGTAGHRVMANGEWASIDSLRYGHIVEKCQKQQRSSITALHSMKCAEEALGTSTPKHQRCFTTDSYGSTQTGQSQSCTTSTMQTATAETTDLRTLSYSAPQTIARNINQKGRGFQRRPCSPQPNGMPHQRDLHGTQKMQSQPSPNGNHKSFPVNSAGHCTKPSTMVGAGFVQITANHNVAENQALMMPNSHALAAGKCSGKTNTPSSAIALPHVLTVVPVGRAKVYDITVSGEHEFYANGVLVHNCARYLVIQAPQWMDYGNQSALTAPFEEAMLEIDPDVALFRLRRLEADRMWAEEGMESEGEPDQIGTFAW